MKKQPAVFIADDNEINRLLLQSQLESLSNNITLAANGKIALEYLESQSYHLILLDIQMPFISGLELIKIIKQKGSINQNVPVIAITAQAQSHERKNLIEAGFDECLIKPILLEQLEGLFDLWLPSTQPKPPAPPINNRDYVSLLLQKTSGNITLATTIFNKLFLELPSQLFLIDRALQTNNLPLALDVTHKLHGSVSFCGFSEMQLLANDLETSFSDHKTHKIPTQFNLLKDKINLFISQKDKILSELEI